MPAPIINWKTTAHINKVENSQLEEKFTQNNVRDKIEKASIKDNTADLIEWLSYAKVFHMFIGDGRKYFAQIEQKWPLIQQQYPELGNKFNFLSSIFSEHHMMRSDSAQMCNRSALIAEFSYK